MAVTRTMEQSGTDLDESYEPVPFHISGSKGEVLVAEELPTHSPYPDVEPYLRDVVVSRNPVTHDVITERMLTLDTAKAYLLACPKVDVYIPPDTLDEMQNPNGGWSIIVSWQGVSMRVPKCRPSRVPLPMADILAQRAEPLRTTQAQARAIYVTEITDGGNGPEITVNPGVN